MYRNNKNISIKALFLGIMLCVFFVSCDDREKESQVSLTFSDTVEDQRYLQNTAITAFTLPAASGGEGELTYSLAPLPDGLTFNSGTRVLSGTPSTVGNTALTYTAEDESLNAATLTFNITVEEDTEPNFGGTIDDQQYLQNSAIAALRLPAASGGNGTLTYSLTPNSPATALPPGLRFNSGTRELRGTPSAAGTTMVTYTVTDADMDTATLTFSIEVTEDLMPTFGGTIDDKQYVLNVDIGTETLPAATGGNGDLTYRLTPSNPAGLTFTPGTRELSGTPMAAGTTMVTYTAMDEDGDPVSLTFRIEVVIDLMPSFAGTVMDQQYLQNSPINPFMLPAASGGDAPLRYTADPLPDGITFNSGTRELSGTPTTVGTTMVTYTATDMDGDATAPLTFSIEVTEDLMPSFGGPLGNVRYVRDSQIPQLILPQASGGNLPLTYTLTPNPPATALPPGLTFNSRRLTGTPTTVGITMVTYTATDEDGDEATLMFSIEVFDPMPMFGETIEDQVYIVGVDIGTVPLPDATDADPPIEYSLTPMPPDGLIFNSVTRELTGMPTAATTSPVDMTYMATDVDGDTTTPLTFTITVEADIMPAFEFDAGGFGLIFDQGTEIPPTEIPAAVGGNAPLTYTLTPEIPGLTFDPNTRMLTGTPTTAATTQHTYTVTDANGDMDMATFFIRVYEMGDRPSFSGQTIESPRVYVTGVTRGPFTLPEATGRDVPLTYSLSPLPDGMTFNTVTRVLSGTPTAASTGVTYTVTDADSQTAELSFTVTTRASENKNICGRTQEVQDAIIAAVSGTPACDAVSETALGGITLLNLESAGINSLQEDDFDDLAGVTDLRLGSNQLESLPQGVFDDLLNLEELDLNSNDLMTLSEDLFRGHSTLTSISLASTAFRAIPENIFSGLFNLRVLTIESRLTAIPEDLFDGLSSLTDLSIDNNNLTTLPEDLFDGLSSLTDLSIDNNSLTTLPANLFDGLTNVTELSLNGNDMTTLPANVFDGLTSLTDLDLRGNNLDSTPAICMTPTVACQE